MRLMDKNKAKLIWNINPETLKEEVNDCPTCKQIDNLCNEYYNITDVDRKDEIIQSLSLFEINAYKLLRLLESRGYTTMNLNRIDYINHFLYSNDYTKNELDKLKIIDPYINDIRIESSRWCAICGTRKPDVFLNDYLLIGDIHEKMTIEELSDTKLNRFEF